MKLLCSLAVALALPVAARADFMGVLVLATTISGHVHARNEATQTLIWFRVDRWEKVPPSWWKILPGDELMLGGDKDHGWTAIRADGAFWRLDPYTPEGPT
jgi:hypothetical protein